MKIYFTLLFLVLIIFLSCDQVIRKSAPIINEANENVVRANLKNKISLQFKDCLPNDWEIWEEYSDENKIHLNHIGKGEFDLHFKAKYQIEDTLFPENTNGKSVNKYYPEFILAFYKNDRSIKESVKFTHENWKIISDTHPMYDVAETKNYLIYGSYNEDQKYQPEDNKLNMLKECIKGKGIIDK